MNLTDEQLRVEVCKVMGWKSHPDQFYQDGLNWTLKDDPNTWATCDLPELNLDLMWEAEETLPENNSQSGLVAYCNTLMTICGSHANCVHATATQRARAFLKVKGVV